MRLESINVGRAETISAGDRAFTTGIRKYPQQGPVRITVNGIPGDAIVDTRHHGGPDQAIYAYGADDYDWWADTTGEDYCPGMFGENLTIRDLPSDLRIGDRLLIGEVVLGIVLIRRMRKDGFIPEAIFDARGRVIVC